ncbi:MAG: lysophospholipid acyltransferase family protein [Kiritimatiellae bacterium]|nr:lysophospholipid acyltransferase family protein [Kiritimatiellia bacterium]
MHRLRHLGEYAALRSVVGVLRCLPPGADFAVAWLIAHLFFNLLRFRRKEAVKRIRSVFGDRFDHASANRVAWNSWCNFVFCILDVIRHPRISTAWAERHFSNCHNTLHPILSHWRGGRGGVLACPHMGSWELAAIILKCFGLPVFSITAREKNPLTDAYFTRLREHTGIPAIQRRSEMLLVKSVLRRLRQGEFLAILPDVRAPTPGIPIRFLGGTANVAPGMALFARRAAVPIFPAVVVRESWRRHAGRIFAPIWPDPHLEEREDWHRMTQQVFDIFDREIRTHPDQWFWYNKRWVLDPLSEGTIATPQGIVQP